MLASFGLYQNPWLNTVSCIVLPVSIGLFYAYSQLVNRQAHIWNVPLFKVFAKRMFRPTLSVGGVLSGLISDTGKLLGKNSNAMFDRVVLGVAILVPLAGLVVMLLGTADPNFGRLVQSWYSMVFVNISWVGLLKLLCMGTLTVLLLAIEKAWREPFECLNDGSERQLDDVVFGIVMSGILIIYVAFLAVQLEYLIVGELPVDYKQAEHMVKSGFWQMLVLSVVNAGLFFIIYKKTGSVAQHILRVFIIASGFLMLSTAWKMSMYVYNYGFSYEKLFASYTTVFSLFVFVYLVIASFSKQRKNIVRTIAFTALWAYSVAAVSPIERLIFHSNVYLAENTNSKVILSQLSQLSLDVLNDVRPALRPILQAQLSFTAQYPADSQIWNNWIQRQEAVFCQRPWYEKNLSIVLVCPE